MPFPTPRPFAAAALALLVGAAAVRADPMDLSYVWNRAQFGVLANGGTRAGGVDFVLPGPGASPVSVLAFTALANGADHYDDVAYSLTFKVSDPAAGKPRDLTVTGELDGAVTSDGVRLGNTFTGGSGSQTFDFLGRDLAVHFAFNAKGSSPRDWAGSITASVHDLGQIGPNGEPTPTTPPPTAASAPEPAALVLAFLALPAVALTRRRLRRR